MLVIGLTGPSGAGKGEVARRFSAYGLPVINADEVYHNLLIPPSPCLDALVEHFGRQILQADGTLNRAALSATVFSDQEKLEALNHIAHRFVMEVVRRDLEDYREQGKLAAVLDAPQLFEAGADADCNIVVAVLAERALRIRRIMQRDGLDEASAVRRTDAQKSDAFFRARADYVIENNGATEHLQSAVDRILCEMGVCPA